MTSEEICSVSEPWFLLPLIYMQKKDSIIAEYGQSIAQRGINELIDQLPNKQNDWDAEIRIFSNNIYTKLAKSNPNAQYFIDKTPRYTLVAEDIIRIFPNAKFIILVRNPIDMLISIIRSWTNNKWKIGAFKIDLEQGFAHLRLLIFKYSENPNVLTIRYEELVENSSIVIMKLESFLNIKINKDLISRSHLDGSLGDKLELRKNKEKKVIVSLFRYYNFKKMINNINNEEWKALGYNKQNLIKEIDTQKRIRSVGLFDMLWSIKDLLRLYFIPRKNKNILY